MTPMERSERASNLAGQAALGSRAALAELKKLFPRREFRRAFCDTYGDVLKCRAKGSKAPWKVIR